MEFTLEIEKRYLCLPVKEDEPKGLFSLLLGETLLDEFEMEMAFEEPDYWVFVDLANVVGEKITIRSDAFKSQNDINLLVMSDEIKGNEACYHEEYRQQIHFSSKRGWLNDPNGLLYADGQYHLYYQHNPYGKKWGNMHWGHAVSSDLMHWKEIGIVLSPDEMGTMFSGSAIKPVKPVSGSDFVVFYTVAGDTSVLSENKKYAQCMALSYDQGLTLEKIDHNPIIPNIIHENRDPKVFYHEPTSRYIMILYLVKNEYGLYASTDLMNWEELQRLFIEDTECPDLFELPVDGDATNTKWVFWGALGAYILGSFDGYTFTPETPTIFSKAKGGNAYAAQTYDNTPGRRIQISWMQNDLALKNMPSSQFMTIPCELTLKTTAEGVRLHMMPVKEIEELYHKSVTYQNLNLSTNEQSIDTQNCRQLKIDVKISLLSSADSSFCINIFGTALSFKGEDRTIRCENASYKMAEANQMIDLSIIIDTTSIEVFSESECIYMPIACLLNESEGISVSGTQACINEMKITSLNSIWR